MKRTGLIILLCLLVTSTALAFNFGLGFNFGQDSKRNYVDLQSSMVWQTYTPTPGTYAFGNHSTTTTADKVFTLSNPGNDVLEAASLAVAGTGFSLQSTTCGSNPFDLVLLTTCTATVRFSPVAGAAYSGTLTASAPNLTSQVVNLSGAGVTAPVAPSTPVISVTPGDTINLVALTSGETGSPTPSYDVKWGTVAGTRSNTISSVALPYTHTGRTNGIPYYYSLVAANSGGSAESSEVSGTPVAAAISDDFNRANVNPIGGNWSSPSGSGAFKIVSNAATIATDDGSKKLAYWNAHAFTNNQCAEAKLSSGLVTDLMGPAINIQASGLNAYYANYHGISQIQSGATTDLVYFTAASLGDTIKLCKSGTTLSVYKNGALQTTTSSSTFTGGSAGIISQWSGDYLDNWVGSDN